MILLPKNMDSEESAGLWLALFRLYELKKLFKKVVKCAWKFIVTTEGVYITAARMGCAIVSACTITIGFVTHTVAEEKLLGLCSRTSRRAATRRAAASTNPTM